MSDELEEQPSADNSPVEPAAAEPQADSPDDDSQQTDVAEAHVEDTPEQDSAPDPVEAEDSATETGNEAAAEVAAAPAVVEDAPEQDAPAEADEQPAAETETARPEPATEPGPEPDSDASTSETAGDETATSSEAAALADLLDGDAPAEPESEANGDTETEAPAADAAALANLLGGDEEDDGLSLDDGPMVERVDDDLRARIQAGIAGMDGEDDLVPDVVDLPAHELRAATEALLLVATRPMTLEKLTGCLPGVTQGRLLGLLEGLQARYEHEYRGWELRPHAGGWQMLTRPALHPWVRQLDKKELPSRLGKSAMETLAIVAYKQPVARGDIEDVRGVQCGPMLRQLMDLKLVQVVGRNDDVVGRPLLYGTTDIFLDRFGLGSIADLPRGHEFGA